MVWVPSSGIRMVVSYGEPSGQMRGRSEVQASIWGIQSAIIFLADNDYHKILMKIVNTEVYNIIRLREQIFIPPELIEVMTRFDSLYSSSYKKGKIVRHIFYYSR